MGQGIQILNYNTQFKTRKMYKVWRDTVNSYIYSNCEKNMMKIFYDDRMLCLRKSLYFIFTSVVYTSNNLNNFFAEIRMPFWMPKIPAIQNFYAWGTQNFIPVRNWLSTFPFKILYKMGGVSYHGIRLHALRLNCTHSDTEI